MANVSSSNGLEKRPKLRFPGFDEPLVKFEIGNACEQLKETIDPRTTPTKFYAEYSMPAFDNNRKVARVQGKDMNSARKIMSKPCVLINKLNVRKKRIWLVEHPEKNAVSSTEFVPLTSTMMSLGYLNYVALTDRFTNYMLNCSSGSSNSQKRVTPDDIMDYVITVPSLLEQERVASFLETIDAKIQAQQDLIELLKKYKRGLNHKLIFEIDEQYNRELGTVCSIVGGGTPDTLRPEYWEGNVEWFTPSEIGKSKYVLSSLRKISQVGLSNSSAKSLPAGTVLLTTRATLGEMSIARSECSTNQGFQSLVADSKRVLPEYLYYLQILIKPWCEKYASGNTFREISKASLSKCVVPVPCLNSQKRIVCILSRIDELIETHERAEDSLTQIKEGLLQQLFI